MAMKVSVSAYQVRYEVLPFHAKEKKLRRTRHFQKSVGLFISAIYGMIMFRNKPTKKSGMKLTISGKIMAPE